MHAELKYDLWCPAAFRFIAKCRVLKVTLQVATHGGGVCGLRLRRFTLKTGMTKYRKGPQRTTKDRKGALRAKLQKIGTS